MIVSTALSALLRKSGVRISIVVAGVLRRSASITLTNCIAPPSGRSSRSTEVTTIWVRPSSAAATATCSGSSGSTARGMPVLTLQKAQARVQVSPRIITVACFLVQHSPIFGQAASSQTVARLSRRISSLGLGEAGAGRRLDPDPVGLALARDAADGGSASLMARQIAILGARLATPSLLAPNGARPWPISATLIEAIAASARPAGARERERWAELAEGQSPKVMVIACSDSRVDPGPDLRRAARARCSSSATSPIWSRRSSPTSGHHGVSAALEFAVTQLEVEEIVVMGHGFCGGCAAALTGQFVGALTRIQSGLRCLAGGR